MSDTELGQSLPARVTFRSATKDDDAFLRRVYACSREAEMRLVPWSEEQKETFLRMQFDAQIQHYQNHYSGATFQVVLCDGETVGRLFLAKIDKELRILDFGILTERRREGIGSLVINNLQRDVEGQSLALTMHIEPYNPSLSLFERLGFRKISEDAFNVLVEWRAPTIG
jgi:ribosomal protein S18 acetylase RimI-like enzyme